jgi:hypothetical protein
MSVIKEANKVHLPSPAHSLAKQVLFSFLIRRLLYNTAFSTVRQSLVQSVKDNVSCLQGFLLIGVSL